jgi:hypothetical protein
VITVVIPEWDEERMIGNVIQMSRLSIGVSQVIMIPDIDEVITEYKNNEFTIGIISKGYLLTSNSVKQRLNAEFSMASKLAYFEGTATVELIMPS